MWVEVRQDDERTLELVRQQRPGTTRWAVGRICFRPSHPGRAWLSAGGQVFASVFSAMCLSPTFSKVV